MSSHSWSAGRALACKACSRHGKGMPVTGGQEGGVMLCLGREEGKQSTEPHTSPTRVLHLKLHLSLKVVSLPTLLIHTRLKASFHLSSSAVTPHGSPARCLEPQLLPRGCWLQQGKRHHLPLLLHRHFLFLHLLPPSGAPPLCE